MFEMLGNQFFLVRNYARAAEMLEKALLVRRGDKQLRRKLIICYTQLGEVEKALTYFCDLIEEDLDFIIHIDPVEEDCPCPDLVHNMERLRRQNRESFDFAVIMGILYLYCDQKKSLVYFRKAQALNPQNPYLTRVMEVIEPRKAHEAEGKGLRAEG